MFSSYLKELHALQSSELTPQDPGDGSEQCGLFWENSDVLDLYQIEAAGEPVGFIMVATERYAHKNVQYRLCELYVSAYHRRRGLGRASVAQLFAQCPGIWELGWMNENGGARSFWLQVVGKLSSQCEDWDFNDGDGVFLPGLKFEISKH